MDLANFLNSMGADIMGAGTDVIKIRGVERLPAAATPSSPTRSRRAPIWPPWPLPGARCSSRTSSPSIWTASPPSWWRWGWMWRSGTTPVVRRRQRPLTRTNVKTLPYPGFPHRYAAPDRRCPLPGRRAPACSPRACGTTATAMWTSSAAWAPRSRWTARWPSSRGVASSPARRIQACDLRAGAAMVIAGLAAQGVTEIGHLPHRAGL